MGSCVEQDGARCLGWLQSRDLTPPPYYTSSKVAPAERSFSAVSRVKNILRSTMCQDRLTSLGTLAIVASLARTLDYELIIDSFARTKSRKAPLL